MSLETRQNLKEKEAAYNTGIRGCC